MLAAVLMILALIGGIAATFFIMDAPRRRAKELQARLESELAAADRERRDNEDWSRDLKSRDREFRDADASLARRLAEFERRLVTHDDLVTENRLIKSDLRNMSLLIGREEQRGNDSVAERSGLVRQRDLLGQAYLEEILAATRRSLTASNYPASKRKIEEALVRLISAGVSVSDAERRRIMDGLQDQYELAVRAAIERDEQARVREQIRDEQRREREAQNAIEQAEQERKAIERALQEALHRAAGQHAAEVDRLKAQLAEAEAKSVRAISQAQITKTGHVYVISNIGSFGSDVFKIGMTRRLDPLDRVYELGDASVPFPFDVHMMISTTDAPKLEKALHRVFHKRRVNRTNPRKEFFRVTIAEIVTAVRDNHGQVEYKADPEALEYIQSQNMTDEEVEEVEEAFEEAEAEVQGDPDKE